MNRFFLYALSLSCSLNLHSNAFVENKHTESVQFNYQYNNYKLNFNLEDFLISEVTNKKDENNIIEDERVLISEIIIEGLEDHPEKERLEVLAYDAMLIRPGSKVTSEEVIIVCPEGA